MADEMSVAFNRNQEELRLPTPADADPIQDASRGRKKTLDLEEIEILAHLLQFAVAIGAARPLAYKLLTQFGSISELCHASERRLKKLIWIESEVALLIRALNATAIFMARPRLLHRPILKDRTDLEFYLFKAMSRLETEEARLLLFDVKYRLISDEVIARGEVNFVHITARMVVSRALDLQATAAILAHNHPSGHPEPSPGDLTMTRRIKVALENVGITLADHIIVGASQCLSLRKNDWWQDDDSNIL